MCVCGETENISKHVSAFPNGSLQKTTLEHLIILCPQTEAPHTHILKFSHQHYQLCILKVWLVIHIRDRHML